MWCGEGGGLSGGGVWAVGRKHGKLVLSDICIRLSFGSPILPFNADRTHNGDNGCNRTTLIMTGHLQSSSGLDLETDKTTTNYKHEIIYARSHSKRLG